jgi:hypothetical protein
LRIKEREFRNNWQGQFGEHLSKQQVSTYMNSKDKLYIFLHKYGHRLAKDKFNHLVQYHHFSEEEKIELKAVYFNTKEAKRNRRYKEKFLPYVDKKVELGEEDAIN